MGRDALLEGYTDVLERLYEPETYFARCLEHLRHFERAPGLARPAAWDEIPVVARSLWLQGVRSPYRRSYWRFLGRVLRRHPGKLPLALAQACAGHHFLTYTRETVVPALRRGARGSSAGYACPSEVAEAR